MGGFVNLHVHIDCFPHVIQLVHINCLFYVGFDKLFREV